MFGVSESLRFRDSLISECRPEIRVMTVESSGIHAMFTEDSAVVCDSISRGYYGRERCCHALRLRMIPFGSPFSEADG